MVLHLQQSDNQWLIGHLDAVVDRAWFMPSYWQQQQQILGQSHGRNVTWFVGLPEQAMVLRHYYRGGLIGKLITDCYWFSSIEQTRAYREFSLLVELERLQLPACRVVAAQVTKTGLIYRADLLMKMVDNGQDLVALLTQGPLTESQWAAIGATIAEFHRARVYHADLNAHNILIDNNQQTWLIDFDRGEIKAEAGAWCQQNLDRLLRSFEKELAQLGVFHFGPQQWQQLLQGYQQAMAVQA
ncbi:MAG: 3-deoxy-D-manno-octulosonic acid kinase [Gammaproteobacteria bacterium]|nr:3-deoxy-D-manno-octulosonic acid kinase [Gammaproteobacteria bacterium]